MKKFLRNLFSGYFLIIIFLVLEIALLLFLQFGLDDYVMKWVGTDADITTVQAIVGLVYVGFRLFIFIITIIIIP